VAHDVPIIRIFCGILQFWLGMILRLNMLALLPDIAMLLPASMTAQ